MKEDFIVELLEPGGGATIPAEVVTAAYVGDNYWLNVQAPDDFDGAQTGQFYHLHVTLEGLDDQQNNAVLYVERQVDKLIVLDRSGSMADQGRIEAARNAASLMTYELSDDDQGAYIRYDETAELSNELEPMDGNQMINMALDIQGTNPGGATCIGCGLQTAADEEDDDGLEDNLCVIALLSDGYENSAPFWADVEAEVADNECYMDVIGLGSQANEALLQQISTSSVGGGNYDFAPTSGDVPIDTDAAPAGNAPEAVQADASWQNYLSRAFDAIAIRATGRQRIFSAVGNNSTGDNPAVLPFMVDPTTDELVVSIAWQASATDQFIRLIDPDGVTLPLAGHQTIIEGDTAEVWRVIAPKDGEWSVLVRGLPQEFHVSASARTLLEMQIYATPPDDYMEQGAKVPIVATFSGSGQPILGAVVKARVTNPSGQQKLLMLYDDGLHADMEADDGVYGNWYTQTTGGEEMVEDPTSYEDGEEPNSRGSYLVQGMATWMDLRREDQTSFFLYEGEDSDGDGYPDRWEEDHDLDPDDPTTPDGDPDGDGLPTRCEWNQGTAPNNPDTDGGGESDGSEVPNCQPGTQDPLEPSDDRIEPLRAVLTSPEAQPDGRPYVKLWLAGLPLKGADLFDVYRRPGNDDDAPWRKVAEDIPAPTFTSVMTNVLSVNAPDPIYRVVPHSAPRVVAGVVQETITGGGVTTAPVPLSSDPYPPSGSIIIAEEPETRSRQVTLLLSANDSGPGHGDFDAPKQPPGTPPTELEMILSTNKAFSDASWQLFQPEVSNFDLGNVQPGEYVTVYVRFRDKAGNISDGFEESATIRYTGSTGYELYLPIIHR